MEKFDAEESNFFYPKCPYDGCMLSTGGKKSLHVGKPI